MKYELYGSIVAVMHIESLAIENFKMFASRQSAELTTPFSVIIGANNAGKSALLDALTLSSDSAPARSEKTIPTYGDVPDPQTRIEVTIHFTSADLDSFFKTVTGQPTVPAPARIQGDPHPVSPHEGVRRLNDLALNPADRQLTLLIDSKTGSKDRRVLASRSFLSLYDHDERSVLQLKGIRGKWEVRQGAATPYASIMIGLLDFSRARIFRFGRQRLVQSSYSVGHNEALGPDGANLAQVLDSLSGRNPHVYQDYLDAVGRVFPEVQYVSSVKLPDSRVETRVWFHPLGSRRDDLALPLHECGTGLAQVMAALYVVTTATTPMVVLLDEPSSFLHPGAVRRFFEVLGDYSHHQYIVATHSPSIVTRLLPRGPAVAILERREAEATIKALPANGATELSALLEAVDARVSDLLGADGVLWVEGPTEERAFARLLAEVDTSQARGITVRRLWSTGDLEQKPRRHVDRVLEVYASLAGGNSLFPPAVAFVLDREMRAPERRKALEERARRIGAKLIFLGKRMLENYVLNADAVFAVLCDDLSRAERDTPERSDVAHRLQQSATQQGDDLDSADLDAARALRETFAHWNVAFAKTTHTVALIEWLSEHDPAALDELRAILADALRR